MKILNNSFPYRKDMNCKLLITILFAVLCVACTSHPDIPSDAQAVDAKPAIAPDYTDVTVPCNICPLNFAVTDRNVTDVVARFTAGDVSYTYGEGSKVMIDETEWKELVSAAIGKAIKVEVFACKDGKWNAYKSFNINVAADSIDQYLSYRLIPPSYVGSEELIIAQRDITTYDESQIYNNMLVSTEKDGQCINCHSYKNYRTDNMMFHMRITYGGTMIVNNGNLDKVNLKIDGKIKGGSYPAWHPTEQLIAFTSDIPGQKFHTKNNNKIEVIGSSSDMILYDVNTHEISIIEDDPEELESFSTWSPDGKWLYYSSAHFAINDTTMTEEEHMLQDYDKIRYSIYRKSFDVKTRKFGPREMVYDAASDSLSVTLPRFSPDGRYLAFACGRYGIFHVWHHDADIRVLDLKTNEFVDMKALNSSRSESYPSFSSNGRWIMTASRRDDGNFTRPYIAYFDKDGKVHKAFELPQRDPHYYISQMNSYNRPEFMIEPVKVTPQEFAAKARTDAEQAKVSPSNSSVR